MSKPLNLICELKFGSHLYGTSTPTSDEDYKGVFLPTKEEILLGRIPRTFHDGTRDDTRKNLPGERDCEYYSLHYFLKLASQGQTGAIDMLFAPESCTFKDPTYGWIWDSLIDNRQQLLSRSMSAFTGYARGQAAKYSLKGERLSKLQEFKTILTNYRSNPNHMWGTTTPTLAPMWDKLPKDDERKNPQGIRELQISGKWFGETTDIMLVEDAITKQLAAYGKRTHAASEAGGVDWKALSHAVRVSKELIELLSFGKIDFPLREAPLLLSIKQGTLPLERVQEIIDTDLAFIEFIAPQSRLPDRVDSVFWDNWLLDIVEKFLTKHETVV